MALHGEIKINHQVLGYWSAQRVTNTTGAPTDDMISEYKCTVSMNHAPEIVFYLTHRYGDGAHILAAKVLRIYDYVKNGITNGPVATTSKN